MYITYVTILLLTLLVLANWRTTTAVIKLFLFTWLFQVLLNLTGIFVYVGTHKMSHDILIASLSSLFVVGAYIGNRGKRAREVRSVFYEKIITKWWAIAIFIIGLIGHILAAYDHIIIRQVSIDSIIRFDLNTIRQVAFEIDAPSTYRVVSYYLMPFTYVHLCILLSRNERMTNILLQMNVLLVLFFSVFIVGSRINIVIVIIMLLSRVNIMSLFSLRKIIISTAMIVFLAMGSAVFFITRDGGVILDYEEAMYSIHRMEYSKDLSLYLKDNLYLDVLGFTLNYFASPIHNLGYYLSIGQIPGPLIGAYSFPSVYDVFDKLKLIEYDWQLVRQIVFDPLVSQKYFPNVWTTIYRDILVDFGYVGGLMFMFLFGYIVSRMFHKTNPMYYVLVPIIIFMPYVSLLYMPFVSYTLLYVGIIVITKVMLVRKT